MAKNLAKKDDLNINFQVSPAETCPFVNQSFDVITANQCWLYFDKAQIIPEVKRLLKPSGLLVTSHFSWLPRLDDIAKRSEELILKHNPNWTAKDWHGNIPIQFDFQQQARSGSILKISKIKEKFDIQLAKL